MTKRLREERADSVCGCRELDIHNGGEGMLEGDCSWKLRGWVSTSHLYTGSRDSKLEVGKGYKLSEPTPSDVLPPVCLHIPVHLWPSLTAPPTGGSVHTTVTQQKWTTDMELLIGALLHVCVQTSTCTMGSVHLIYAFQARFTFYWLILSRGKPKKPFSSVSAPSQQLWEIGYLLQKIEVFT